MYARGFASLVSLKLDQRRIAKFHWERYWFHERGRDGEFSGHRDDDPAGRVLLFYLHITSTLDCGDCMWNITNLPRAIFGILGAGLGLEITTRTSTWICLSALVAVGNHVTEGGSAFGVTSLPSRLYSSVGPLCRSATTHHRLPTTSDSAVVDPASCADEMVLTTVVLWRAFISSELESFSIDMKKARYILRPSFDEPCWLIHLAMRPWLLRPKTRLIYWGSKSSLSSIYHYPNLLFKWEDYNDSTWGKGYLVCYCIQW